MRLSLLVFSVVIIFVSSVTISSLTYLSYHISHLLSEGVARVLDQDLVATRSLALIDMSHDAVRGIVLGKLANVTSQEDSLVELQEEKEKLRGLVLQLQKAFGNDRKWVQSLKQVEGDIAVYLDQGETLLRASRERIPDFEKAFESLESSLEKVGDEYEIDAGVRLKALAEAAKGSDKRLVAIAGFLFLLNLVFLAVLMFSMMRRFGQLSHRLRNASRELAQGGTRLEFSAGIFANGVAKQAAALEQTAASSEEITAMAKRMNEAAVLSQELTQQSTALIGKSVGELDFLVTAVQNVHEHQDKMKGIISLIDDVAFQIQLLSLNAAVEAARAGEQGRGFAVVAESIKALSAKIASSSDEIRESIDLVAAQVDLSHQQMVKTHQSFTQVMPELEQVKKHSDDIAAMAQEQTLGVSQINQAMNELSQVTQQSASQSEANAESLKSLNEQVDEMRSLADNMQGLVGVRGASEKFVWNEAYRLGVKKMDDQHHQLIDEINQFAEALSNKARVAEALQSLIQYTRFHFNEEENYMKYIRYPHLEEHKGIHSRLLSALDQLLVQGRSGVLNEQEVMGFINDWLLKHILGTDMQYAHFQKLPPEQMKRAA